jgi:hypothetical protein
MKDGFGLAQLGQGLGNIFGGLGQQQASQNSQRVPNGLQAQGIRQGAQLGQGLSLTQSNIALGGVTAQIHTPLTIKTPNGDNIDVAKEILLMRYILQRTVPDYDEVVKQFNAIEDIKGAEQWDK